MAKDDYYVIVYKILAYLYIQLKNGESIDVSMLKHDGHLFQINELYWTYILRHMYEDGYIEDITITKAFGETYIIHNLDSIQITPLGIDYLCNNKLLEKAKRFLKDVKDITPFI